MKFDKKNVYIWNSPELYDKRVFVADDLSALEEAVENEDEEELCVLNQKTDRLYINGNYWNFAYWSPEMDGKFDKKKERPFESREELIKWWIEKYQSRNIPPNTEPIIWISDKNKNIWQIVGFTQCCVYTVTLLISFKELFEQYTFLDGKKCGVIE